MTYQALIILKNSTAENAVEGVLETVRAEITKLKGTVTETAILGKQTFVRTMQKTDSGYYAKLRFTLEPRSQAALLARLKLIDTLFRVQIVALDADAAAKPLLKSSATEPVAAGEKKPDGQS